MKTDTLLKATELHHEMEYLTRALETWERAEKGPLGYGRDPIWHVCEQAWNKIRAIAKEDIQRQFDAKRAEFEAL